MRDTTRRTDIGRVDWPRLPESIPHADEADLAVQAIDEDGGNDVVDSTCRSRNSVTAAAQVVTHVQQHALWTELLLFEYGIGTASPADSMRRPSPCYSRRSEPAIHSCGR